MTKYDQAVSALILLDQIEDWRKGKYRIGANLHSSRQYVTVRLPDNLSAEAKEWLTLSLSRAINAMGEAITDAAIANYRKSIAILCDEARAEAHTVLSFSIRKEEEVMA